MIAGLFSAKLVLRRNFSISFLLDAIKLRSSLSPIPKMTRPH